MYTQSDFKSMAGRTRIELASHSRQPCILAVRRTPRMRHLRRGISVPATDPMSVFVSYDYIVSHFPGSVNYFFKPRQYTYAAHSKRANCIDPKASRQPPSGNDNASTPNAKQKIINHRGILDMWHHKNRPE